MALSPYDELVDRIAFTPATAIIGTGVSIDATEGNQQAASWSGLLAAGIDYCREWCNPKPTQEWVEHQRKTLGDGRLESLISVASAIEASLKAPDGPRYRHFLKETIGELWASKIDVLEGIQALRAAGLTLATTNYDGLIERQLAVPAVPWTDTSSAEAVIRQEAPGVLHLHGFWEAPPSVVLGGGSYDAVVRNAHAQTIQRLLAVGQSLVFIGYGEGLADPNFGALFEWLRSDLPGSGLNHFRLCRLSEEEKLRAVHEADSRMVVICYGEHHSDLGPFLTKLAAAVHARRHARPQQTPRAKPPGIRFIADCVVDRDSVREILRDPRGNAAIIWHDAVTSELRRLEEWWSNFDFQAKTIFSALEGEQRQNTLTRLRAHILKDRDRIRTALDSTSSSVEQMRRICETLDARDAETALSQLLNFAALQLIRLIQFTDNYLGYVSFPTLPRVPDFLIDLVPDRSALGALAFQEFQFLRCRIGINGEPEEVYEYVIMPRDLAEYLHLHAKPLPSAYYQWVLPQWIHFRFERPLPREDGWSVMVLVDKPGRECYFPRSFRPWQDQ